MITANTKITVPRKIFTVIIHDKEYDVFDIESKEHEGLNDTCKSWWLYYSDRLLGGMIPPCESDFWKPYDVSILRCVWDIRIKQSNSTKEKWGSTHFRNHTTVEMWCNKKLVYAFGTGGKYTDFAMAKVQYLQTMMSEHPYNFFEPEKENGRKICWYGLPATVKVKSNTWEIGIVPDYTAELSKEEWWKEYANRRKLYSKPTDMDEIDSAEFEDDKRSDYINWGDALSDQNIYWFRK